jgi:ribosomal protein S18 acetylase RimI-like enzyme
MKIVPAKWEEHDEVAKVAKLSKFSKGFAGGGLRYVEEYYAKGWVLVAKERGKILGFICVRHCVVKSKPHTSVYYLGVAKKRCGIGTRLIDAVMAESKWKCIELISEKENLEGLAFYQTIGFKTIGDGANAAGVPYWRLEKKA